MVLRSIRLLFMLLKPLLACYITLHILASLHRPLRNLYHDAFLVTGCGVAAAPQPYRNDIGCRGITSVQVLLEETSIALSVADSGDHHHEALNKSAYQGIPIEAIAAAHSLRKLYNALAAKISSMRDR